MNVGQHAEAFAAAARAPRVLHVIRQFLPNRGGLEDVARHLCREQLSLGVDARVLTLDRLFVRPDAVLPARETIEGIDVTRIPFRGSTRYPIAPGFLRHLRGVDLVHVHAVDFFFDALALTRPLHRRPLVATTHGGFFHTRAFSGLKSLWFRGPTRLSARAYAAVVGCGNSDAAAFAPAVRGGVRVIRNGVDTAKFAGAASPAPVRHMVTLGRFSDNKRLDRLVAALAALRAAEPDWRLTVLGLESDWSAARLRGAIAAAGQSDAASVLVGLDDADTAREMARASLFVSASEYEGFGLVLVEALSAGLAPVVHPNSSYRALAADHPEVTLADFADPAEAARAIRDRFARLGREGRPAPDLSAYGWPGVARQYLDVYAACCPAFAAP